MTEKEMGRFSEGQEQSADDTEEKQLVGHFSAGQEQVHDMSAHGHFSAGQERRPHGTDADHTGNFAEGQETN